MDAFVIRVITSEDDFTAICRYVNSLRPTDRPIRMMERSVYSGYACFLATSR